MGNRRSYVYRVVLGPEICGNRRPSIFLALFREGRTLLRIVVLITIAALFVCFTLTAASADGPRRIIYSTDIGDDIDDAFGLVFALNSPELEVDSVVNSYGATQRRAPLTAKLLEIAGRRDVPNIIGRHTDYWLSSSGGNQFPWAEGFVYTRPPVTDGWRAMARRIMNAPGKVTLVPVGPLTDIADLLENEPKVKDKIDEIILMGGSVYYGYNMSRGMAREYNIRGDSKAAQVVFTSGVPIVMIGLDVTAMMQPSDEDMAALAATEKPLAKACHELYEYWAETNRQRGRSTTPTMFDSVAVAVVFQRDLCKYEEMRIQVDDLGFTRKVEGEPNAIVGVEVDKDRFFKLFWERIMKR